MNKFIVFEGLDGSGKDTQLNKAVDYMRTRDKYAQIWITREPTNNTVAGREIARRLKQEGFKDGHEALMLYVQDRIEQTLIRREILQHSHIIASRFDNSTYAYQWAQWLSFDEIYKAHNYDEILVPDLTLIFDVDKENIEKRLWKRGGEKEFFEQIDFLMKVREKYLESTKKLSQERKIVIIDANQGIEDVFEQVKKELEKELL